MTGGPVLDQIEIQLRDINSGNLHSIYIDVFDNSLSRKWLTALNNLIKNNFHLEKNYCFLGFPHNNRSANVLLEQINLSIKIINDANIGYKINDVFTLDNTVLQGEVGYGKPGGKIIHEKLNFLHRYFEDLQGQSGKLSQYYLDASSTIKWHIRQLNLLCHEYESLILSKRKIKYQPEWVRPSQLMCWLNAPRFKLENEDYNLFGIETINRPLGGVYVGVNKSVGKHYWEVFNDEGKNSRVSNLITSTMITQTEGAGDFDIEWGRDPKDYEFQKEKLSDFRQWLIDNKFNPDDKLLTIGHPWVGQVNLDKSFKTVEYREIWNVLETYLDVYSIKTADASAVYDYHWSDADFVDKQIKIIEQGK